MYQSGETDFSDWDKVWNWKICEFGVFALFKPNQISKLIHVLNYGWHLKTLFLELKIFSRLWVKTERLEQEIKNFDLFWNQLVQYIIIENLKGMKFFVTFWISDHATRFGNGYNMKYIIYYMQIIIQIRRQNTIDMMHIWIRIGLSRFRIGSQSDQIRNANHDQSFNFSIILPWSTYFFASLILRFVLRKLKTTGSSFDNSQSTLIYCAKISTNVLLR